MDDEQHEDLRTIGTESTYVFEHCAGVVRSTDASLEKLQLRLVTLLSSDRPFYIACLFKPS